MLCQLLTMMKELVKIQNKGELRKFIQNDKIDGRDRVWYYQNIDKNKIMALDNKKELFRYIDGILQSEYIFKETIEFPREVCRDFGVYKIYLHIYQTMSPGIEHVDNVAGGLGHITKYNELTLCEVVFKR